MLDNLVDDLQLGAVLGQGLTRKVRMFLQIVLVLKSSRRNTINRSLLFQSFFCSFTRGHDNFQKLLLREGIIRLKDRRQTDLRKMLQRKAAKECEILILTMNAQFLRMLNTFEVDTKDIKTLKFEHHLLKLWTSKACSLFHHLSRYSFSYSKLTILYYVPQKKIKNL